MTKRALCAPATIHCAPLYPLRHIPSVSLLQISSNEFEVTPKLRQIKFLKNDRTFFFKLIELT